MAHRLADLHGLITASTRIACAFVSQQTTAVQSYVRTSSLRCTSDSHSLSRSQSHQAQQRQKPTPASEAPNDAFEAHKGDATNRPTVYLNLSSGNIEEDAGKTITSSRTATAKPAAPSYTSSATTIYPPLEDTPQPTIDRLNTNGTHSATTVVDPLPETPQNSCYHIPATTPSKSAVEAEEPIGSPSEVPLDRKSALRPARIPTSRIGRMLNYGGLGLGLGMGAVSEAIRRAAGSVSTPSSGLLMSESNIERIVSTLSRMRGAALKLGQIMSIQDTNMLSPELERVFFRVQNSANYMPSKQLESVLSRELGSNWQTLFSSFDPIPIAAASIGQVHQGTMASNGQLVAVKVQYPGVASSIASDLANVKSLLSFADFLPKGLYLDNTIKVARRELAWECDYVREKDSILKFKGFLQGDSMFDVPDVIEEASSKGVLTTTLMGGETLTNAVNFDQKTKDKIGTHILNLCLREVFEFRFMQTDPNWTNFLYNRRTGKIELLDFGASRGFDKRFTDLYLKVLIAAQEGDRQGCLQHSEAMGFLTGFESETMRSAHIDSMIALGEPFSSRSPQPYSFSNQTITNRVRGQIPTMLRERLTPPPDETYSLHRKLSGSFLLCAKMGAQIDCAKLFKGVVQKYQYD